MKESTNETISAEQMKALVNSNLIGGIVIGVVGGWTLYRAAKWAGRKTNRIARHNKRTVKEYQTS